MNKKTMDDLSKDARNTADDKGFYTPSSISTKDEPKTKLTEADVMLGKLALVHSEVSEAVEAVRNGDVVNFKQEIADIFIRLFDICGAMGINIQELIEAKMEVNKMRPPLHGHKSNL